MSDETSTLEGGGEALPQQSSQPAYVDDVSTPVEAVEAVEAPEAPEVKPEPKEDKRKNRTREYIDRINGERAELARELAEIKARLPAVPEPKAPAIEDFDYDHAEHARAVARWEIQEDRKAQAANQTKEAEAQRQQQAVAAYEQRAAEFYDQHEDFLDVVNAIPPAMLTHELQAAIMAHENGPEIAYRLAQDEDALFDLASRRPEMMDAAVARFASRMSAAPPQEPAPPAIPALAQPTKPISQAPAPAPRVGGRSVSETPAEKLTDDQWFKREREKSRG